jgi:hypothetical protein
MERYQYKFNAPKVNNCSVRIKCAVRQTSPHLQPGIISAQGTFPQGLKKCSFA